MKITDICDFQGGSQPPKEEWSFVEKPGYIRMLQIRDFTQSGKVVPEYIKMTKNTKLCEVDDILIARYGASLGKILTGQAGAYNVAIMKTVPDTNKIKKKYLYYYLKSPYFQRAILNVGVRAAQAGFNKEDLSKLDIDCPSLVKQEFIISIFENIEHVIAKRSQQLAALDELVKARFVEMFGDPVSNSKQLPSQKLGEICDLKAGDFTAAEDIYEVQDNKNPYPCYGGNGIRGYVNNYTQEGEFPIIGRQGALCGNIQYAKGKFRNTEHAVLVTPKVELDKIWLFELLKLEDLYRFHTGAAQPGLAVKTLNMISVPLAELEEQKIFAKFFNQINKTKDVVQNALDKTQTLFNSLMQQYFG